MTRQDIDLRLLRCLETLVAERHVSRAADAMDMSQSGMSAALARLRTIFHDPILIRTPNGMDLSDRAPEIAGAARRALSEIDLVLAEQVSFDPASAETTFTIMASDYVGRMILPQLVATLRENAPGITLTIAAPQPTRIRETLANSEVDLVVGFFHDLSEGLLQTKIADETLCCLVRQGHPSIAETFTLADYVALDHLFYGSPPGFVSSLEVMIKRVLQPLGVERRISTQVPLLTMMPRIVLATNMAATLPMSFARSYETTLGLNVLPLPIDVGPLPVRAIWHERMHRNVAHRWLRQKIKEIARVPKG